MTSFVAQKSAGLIDWKDHIADLFMASQVSASQAQAKLLIGDGLYRINYAAATKTFTLDDASAETLQALQGLGSSVGRRNDHLTKVKAAFLNGVKAKEFTPSHAL